MTIALVQARKTGVVSNTSFTPTALTTQPTAGSLLVLVIGLSKGSATIPNISAAPAGWSFLVTGTGAANGSFSGGHYILGRIATGSAGAGTGTGTSQTGGDDPPTVSLSVTANITYGLEEWPGSGAGNIDTSSFPDAAAAVATGTLTTGITGNTLTVSGSNEWAYVSYGGRAALGTITWGGSLTSNLAATGTGGAQIASATQLLSSGSITPAPTFTNSQGGPVNALGSFAFKTISSSPTGSGTATATLTGTAAGVVGTVGAATQTATLTGTSAGVVGTSTGASQTATLTGTAAGAVGVVTGAATTLTFTATASGVVGGSGVTGTGSTTLTVTATSGGVVGTVAAASQTATFTATGAGRVGTSTSAAQTLTLTATASGVVAIGNSTGTASTTLTFTTSASGIVSGPQRDLTFAVQVGASRWSVSAGHRRWSVQVAPDRWGIQV